MIITAQKQQMVLDLLPDFNTYDGEIFNVQVHQREVIVFTLPKVPLGIPVYELVYRKNHRLGVWECNYNKAI
jgi:hypothetical protein